MHVLFLATQKVYMVLNYLANKVNKILYRHKATFAQGRTINDRETRHTVLSAGNKTNSLGLLKCILVKHLL